MAKALSTAEVELVPIAKIVIGVRRRKNMGNLRALARSIEARGLIHPILLRGTDLVAGERRLRACQSLGWSKIPARSVERMTDEEVRAIELEENTERLGLLDYEASRQRLAEIRQAEADLRTEGFRGESQRNPKGGRPKRAGSRRDVAAVTGVSPKSQSQTERHVALAEQYPFMQAPGWKQYRVLEAGEKLDKLPAKERTSVAVLLDQPAIPPSDAIKILDNLGHLSPTKREAIYAQARSEDKQERRQALALAAAMPPVPDPGLLHLVEAERLAKRAEQDSRVKGAVAIIAPAVDAIAKAITGLREKGRDGA